MVQPLSPADIEAKLLASRRLVAEKWGWFLALGIVLILVGFAAIVWPFPATVAAKVVLGWLFLVGGVVMIIHAFSTQAWSGFFWSLLIGILYLVVLALSVWRA